MHIDAIGKLLVDIARASSQVGLDEGSLAETAWCNELNIVTIVK